MIPQEFVAKWRGATLKERSAAQNHFINICYQVKHPTTAELDPKGERSCFMRDMSWYNMLLEFDKQCGGVDGLWIMHSMKENEREVPNDTEAS